MNLVTGPEFDQSSTSPLATNVFSVIEKVLTCERENNQRQSKRFPFAQLVELTYFNPETDETISRPVTVACKNLSLGGLGFFHNSPLPLRNVLVQLSPGSDLPQIVAKLVWCRCSTAEWYEHGGQFSHLHNNTPGS